jgi:hypothetical protein
MGDMGPTCRCFETRAVAGSMRHWLLNRYQTVDRRNQLRWNMGPDLMTINK